MNRNCKFEALGELICVAKQIENDETNVYKNFLM